MRRTTSLFTATLLFAPALLIAQPYETSFFDNCSGQNVGVDVSIEFTPTGGDFVAGTGTGTVVFTVENISGLYPVLGNPVLTRFYFNVNSGASATFVEARVPVGSTIRSTGTEVLGDPIPVGCSQLAVDEVHTNWYTLESIPGVGQFGVFTAGANTTDGIKAGLVDASAIVNCVDQGNIFSPLVIAGPVKFTFDLQGLDATLDSADKFQHHCSTVEGEKTASAFGGKFQGLGAGGGGSCFLGDPCETVSVEETTWAEMKTLFRNNSR